MMVEYEYQNPADAAAHWHAPEDIQGLRAELDALQGRLAGAEAKIAAMSAPPPLPLPPPSALVASLDWLLEAIADGEPDITITAPITAPPGGVAVPRLQGGRTLRCAGAGILARGGQTGPVLHSPGVGGEMTLIGIRIDGGWRSTPRELGHWENNANLLGFDLLTIEDCTFAWSLRCGLNVEGGRRVEIRRSTFFGCPRDSVWDKGAAIYISEDNLFQHIGDDGWGTHFAPGPVPQIRHIVCRRNTFRDTFGPKGHGGAADGEIDGMPSMVLIEGNLIEAPGLYGVNFLYDPNNREPVAAPRNIAIRGNTIRDVRATAPCAPGQRIGRWVQFEFPGHGFDGSTAITGNTLERNPEFAGKRLQDCYDWARKDSPLKPAIVPGAADVEGAFSKTGFLPAATIDLAADGSRFVGQNAAAIVRSWNSFIGSGWANTGL